MKKGDANVTITADARAFAATLKQVEKNTDTMANSVTARLTRLGGALSTLKTIGETVVAAVSTVTRPAMELENVSTSLGLLMGNTEEAEKLARALRMVAVNGVVSFEELHRAAQPLVEVYGGADQIADMVKRMADLAAASKLPADRFATMVARLKDMGKAEFTELANAGLPIFETLAEVMGKSVGEVIKLRSQIGGITVSDFTEAIRRMTDESGRFHRVNSEMSNTTEGSWDTLKASIEACREAIGTPINDAMRPWLQEMSARLQENIDKLREWSEHVMAMGRVFANGYGAADKKVGGVLGMFAPVLRASAGLGAGMAALWGESGAARIEAEKELMRAQAERGKKARRLGLQEAAGIEANAKAVEDMRAAMQERQGSRFERELERMKPDDARRARMEAAGVSGVGELLGEMKTLEQAYEQYGELSEQQVARYRVLVDLEKKLAEMHRTRTEELKRQADVEEQAMANYRQRRHDFELRRQESRRGRMSLAEQRGALEGEAREAGVRGKVTGRSIRARLDELAHGGAKSNERQIAQLERVLAGYTELLEKRREFARADAALVGDTRVRALELTGQDAAADKLREQLRLQERITELQQQGYTAADAAAQAGIEGKMDQLQRLQEVQRAAGVDYIQGHLAAQGGGGVSVRLNSMQSSAREQVKIQRDIYRWLKQNGGKGGGAVAVLA